MALNIEYTKKILDSALFSGCETTEYKNLVQSLSPISILKRQSISSACCQKPALGFILEGSLDVCNSNDVLFSTLEAGDFFEIESLFSQVKPMLPLYMRAKTNCIVTFISKSMLLPILEENRTIAFNYMEILANEMQYLTCRLWHFTAGSPSVNLSLYLLRHSQQGIFQISDGFSGLARRLNISRATLYRALSELEEKQLICHQEKTIHILRPEELYCYAHTNSTASSSLTSTVTPDQI